jgi:hypothetical protein
MQLVPEFHEIIERGQEDFQQFFKVRKTQPLDDILKEYVDQRGVVLGVFEDAKNELGWDTALIKGQDALTAIFFCGIVAQSEIIGVIPCACGEAAFTMCEVFGDGQDP